MPMRQSETLSLVRGLLMPTFQAEKDRLDRIDNWYRWDHDSPHQPRHSTSEYKELSARSQTPWLGLVVTSVAQSLYVEGYRRADDPDDAAPWQWWQTNGMDRRQIAVHRAALAYGLSYASVLPGADDFNTAMPVIRGHSPRRMITFYDEPARDDWPHFALEIEPARINGTMGYALRVYDDTSVYFLQADSSGTSLTWVESRLHDVNVCPVVRFTNLLDLEGRADGEVEPFIPVAGRIDQTVFDRLVVQRFSSWVVRTVTGMAKPESDEDAAATRLRLKVEDLLIGEEGVTFGSLPATPLDGFISAAKADIQALAAVSQTPAHELVGDMVNLSAEALAAARASLTAKVEERKHSFGESWEQLLRLSSWVMGDTDAARDYSAQVRWKDTEIRSLAQAADALGKLATMLGVPVEMLWEKVPGWTDQDVERAKALAAQSGGVEALVRQLTADQPVTVDAEDPGEIKAKADAMGVLIRSGVDPDSAAAKVGLSGVKFTGAVPVSLRQPETAAASLED